MNPVGLMDLNPTLDNLSPAPAPPGSIHPSAVIENGAQIDPSAIVGPMCYIGPKVIIGAGTHLISHVSIFGRTTLGITNTIWPQATLGADPQDLKYRGEDTQLVIGDNNEIRESATFHKGTEVGGGVTSVGSDNLIMVGAHIAHDCKVGNHVIIANNSLLAGHVVVEDHSTISGLAACHHFVTIGQYSYVGGLARVTRDVPPFMLFEGHQGRVRGLNAIGLERHRFPPETIVRLKDAYRRLFRDDTESAEGEMLPPSNMTQRVNDLEKDYPDDECVILLVRSLRNSMQGLHGRCLEGRRRDDRRRNPTK